MTTYEKFKISLMTLFVLGFLFCFYNYSRNGKYVFKNGSNTVVLDTQSGALYLPLARVQINLDEYKEQPKPKQK